MNTTHAQNQGYTIPANVQWSKTYGPFLLYLNGLPNGEAGWADAQNQFAAERAAWPYSWLTGNNSFATQAERTTVSGKLVIQDALRPAASADRAWVGVVAPDNGSENAPDNWQFQHEGYQYWVSADADGNFTIPNVRVNSTTGGPATYALHAYSEGTVPGTGAVGEFRSQPFTVSPGSPKNLGTLTWNVFHPGSSTVFEIGVPNRSAIEFKNGNRHATAELVKELNAEFTNPLEYNTAANDWGNRLNYAHACGWVTSGDPAVDNPGWQWNLNFDLPAPTIGTYWLNIAYAVSTSVQIVKVNGTTLAAFTPENTHQNGSALLRQAISQKYGVSRVAIPHSLLHAGHNVITLAHEVHSNRDRVCFMYDYINLEAPEPPVLPPGRDLNWKGGVSSNAWNQTAVNWVLEGTTSPTLAFVDGDRVAFTDSSSTSPALTLSGNLQPGRVTFANSTAKSCTLGGSGSLTGPFQLLKTANGTLTISPLQQNLSATTTSGSTAVSMASTTGVSAGMWVNGTGVPAGTTVTDVQPGGVTLSAPATASATNTLTFGTIHSFYGGADLNAGTVVFTNLSANHGGLGSGPITFNGGTLSMWDSQTVFHTAPWSMVVPAGASGKLNACSRVDLYGRLSGGGVFEFYVPWVRTTVFGNWSSFTGQLNIRTDASGGDWRIGSNFGCPQAAVDLGPLVITYSTLSGNQAIPIGELTGAATSVLTSSGTGTTTWRVGSRNSDAVFQGNIANGTSPAVTSLDKTGEGIWTLAGTCTHSGATTVSAGTLRIQGSSTASAFTVSPDATLGGSGSITGTIDIQSGGKLELSTLPLQVTGNISFAENLTIAAPSDPGPGAHILANYSGTVTGSPSITLDFPTSVPYLASLSTTNGQVALVLQLEDSDQDLIKDEWELTYYPSVSTVGPLDDTDGDGYNTYTEFINGTSPTDPYSLPVIASHAVSTSMGEGLDGTLYEIGGDGQYGGSFTTNDPNKRNIVRQDPTGPRHSFTVLKFDLNTIPAGQVAGGSLVLTINGSTSGLRVRTLSIFNGDDSLITDSIRYDAANPFIDDSYLPESNTDTDFANGTVTPLLTYTNATGGGTIETIGSGNTALRHAIRDALATDRILTLILHGGSTQYLTQGDEDTTLANHPTLTITMGGNPTPDLDGDGMADAWEAAYFGTLARDGSGDMDADGSSDSTEFRLGLNPGDAYQAFRASATRDINGFSLTWPSQSGLTFRIRRSLGLGSGSWQEIATVPADPGTSTRFTDTEPPEGNAFYQIVLPP